MLVDDLAFWTENERNVFLKQTSSQQIFSESQEEKYGIEDVRPWLKPIKVVEDSNFGLLQV